MRLFFLSLLTLISVCAGAQFSLSTDIALLRNHSPQQRFWSAGQSIRGGWYTSPKGGPYVALTYFLRGKFDNRFTAFAQDPATTQPGQQDYRVQSSWQYRQFSLGWKHYLKGAYNLEKSWSLYGSAGFGLLFSNVVNSFSQPVDTSLYLVSGPTARSGSFRRLTFDLGLGAEWEIGADIYAYGEMRSWLQASDTPSPLLVQNCDVPLTTSLHAGLRILIR